MAEISFIFFQIKSRAAALAPAEFNRNFVDFFIVGAIKKFLKDFLKKFQVDPPLFLSDLDDKGGQLEHFLIMHNCLLWF